MPDTPGPAAESLPKRILFFAFEGGTGIGHLRRISRIAAALERSFACLIVTGHRGITDWFISPGCEYVHIPAWESLLAEKADYWSRKPFLPLSVEDAVRLRKKLIQSVVEAYAPDLIVVDHLPLGMHGELDEIVRDTPCRKYLVTRGVLNVSGNLLDLVLGDRAREYLHRHYDRIVVAADRNVIDFAREYALPAELAAKTVHVGYVIDPIDAKDIAAFRADRAGEARTWVVVSAGGGQLGENLIRHAVALSAEHPDVLFDVIAGPRSNLAGPAGGAAPRNNLRVHARTRDMPRLNAGADIVICSGGYNTLLEALQGNARILCLPGWKDPRDEQTHHPRCLRKFADIEIVSGVDSLGNAFAATLARASTGKADDRRRLLDLSGVDAIERLVSVDLRQQ